MDKIKQKIKYLLLFSLILPSISHAQGILELLNALRGVLRRIPVVLFGLSTVYFFWGVAQFIKSAGNEKTREDGRNKMIWGIIALFVFASIGGILTFMHNVLGI